MAKALCLNIPNAQSPSEAWVSWHKELKKCVGKGKANNLWIMAWAKYGKVGNDASTVALRDYMGSQGVDVERDWDEVGIDLFAGIGNAIGSVFSTGGALTTGLAVVMIGGIGWVIFNMGKDPDAVIRTGTAIGTRGASEALPMK